MKKTVSVIGCCASRNIFNYGPMSEVWDVKCYAFQNLPWAMFEDGLNIPYEEIYKAENAKFTNRMIDYDLNKETLYEIKKASAEYLVIDLCTFFFKQYEISFGNKVVHASNAFSPDCFSKLKNVPYLKDIQFRQLSDSDILYDEKFQGLEKFAEWIKHNYDLSKVIIYVPLYARKYINKDLTIVPFSEKLDAIQNERNKKVVELSEKFYELLNRECNYIVSNDGKIARDDGLIDDPSGLHVTAIDNIKQGLTFNESLGIHNLYDADTYISLYIEEKISALNEKNKEKQDVKKTQDSNFFDLTSFVSSLDLNKKMILFSVSDEASRYKSKIPSALLGIKNDYGYRQGYVCAVYSNCERIEKYSDDSVFCESEFCGVHFSVESNGYNSIKKKESKFVIGNNEYVCKQRGLNILVYDFSEKTVELFNCDLYADEKATVKKISE